MSSTTTLFEPKETNNTYMFFNPLLVHLTINGLVPQTIFGLVTSASNGYVIIPFNFKINLTLSGDLI